MDSRNKQHNNSSDHLGVNKIGKNIKKSTLNQPEFTNNPQYQPQVYNINKNDFRSVVQQLTGSSSQEVQPVQAQAQLAPPPPRPPSTTNNIRLQKIRPPPLTPLINRPQVPQPNNPTESPVTTYMRYLQNSIVEPGQAAQVQQPQFQQQTPSMPSGFLNLISPKSPFPLLSPGYQFPLTPNFPFSPLGMSGILGPGQQPPLSPGFGFSLSPSSFFQFSSPKWRDH